MKKMNLLTLSFKDQEFENRYIQATELRTRYQGTIAIFVGIFVYLLGGIIDQWFVPPDVADKVWTIRLSALIVPITVLLLMLTPIFTRYSHKLLAIIGFTAGAGIIVIQMLIPVESTPYYYPMLILAVFYTYIFIGTRFIYALYVDISLLLAYNFVFGWIMDFPMHILISHDIYIISANLIGGSAGYLTEWQRRTLFIRERELEEERQHHMHRAHHDPLTGLPNRLFFTDQLKQGIENAKQKQQGLAIFFIDLDKFKEINDSLGHDVGDKVLKIVAEILKNSIRKEDTLARLAGDEFTVIMESLINTRDVSTIAHNILSKFEKPIHLDDHVIYLTCSIGIGLYPQDSDNEKDLLKYADTAMYIAKESGRNSIQFYHPEMTTHALEQIKMKASLRQAIDNNEFIIHYQPQVDLTTNNIVGFEALIRWQHPMKGMLTPKKFLSLAEETGMIIEIDQWVMQTTMKQVAQWYNDGLSPGLLALNVSMKQLENTDFYSNIQNNMETYSFKPEWLELEITEGHMMKDPVAIINILKQISSLGISISIDDFGTGYSSLSILKGLPINRLKIDRSFIQDIPEDEDDIAIINSIIALAKSLNLDLIAEGIETLEQANFLISRNVMCAQGYYYSHPLPEEEVKKLLSK